MQVSPRLPGSGTSTVPNICPFFLDNPDTSRRPTLYFNTVDASTAGRLIPALHNRRTVARTLFSSERSRQFLHNMSCWIVLGLRLRRRGSLSCATGGREWAGSGGPTIKVAGVCAAQGLGIEAKNTEEACTSNSGSNNHLPPANCHRSKRCLLFAEATYSRVAASDTASVAAAAAACAPADAAGGRTAGAAASYPCRTRSARGGGAGHGACVHRIGGGDSLLL